jgi:DNA-3-methyladenine glycosylase II
MRIEEALRQLSSKDPVMKDLIAKVTPIVIQPIEDYFKCLVMSIISQMISSKAADTVTARLSTYCNNVIDPTTLLVIDSETYRTFGIGPQKSGHIKALAQAFLDHEAELTQLHLLEDHEVVNRLTAIKGIGRWTAEMFLIFGLGRLDVFASDDLGLRNAMIRHFGMVNPSRKDLAEKAEAWAPYRSVASLLLWRSLSL